MAHDPKPADPSIETAIEEPDPAPDAVADPDPVVEEIEETGEPSGGNFA